MNKFIAAVLMFCGMSLAHATTYCIYGPSGQSHGGSGPNGSWVVTDEDACVSNLAAAVSSYDMAHAGQTCNPITFTNSNGFLYYYNGSGNWFAAAKWVTYAGWQGYSNGCSNYHMSGPWIGCTDGSC